MSVTVELNFCDILVKTDDGDSLSFRVSRDRLLCRIEPFGPDDQTAAAVDLTREDLLTLSRELNRIAADMEPMHNGPLEPAEGDS